MTAHRLSYTLSKARVEPFAGPVWSGTDTASDCACTLKELKYPMRLRIPNHNLQPCYDQVPVMQTVQPLTIGKSLKSLDKSLRGRQQQDSVSFRSLQVETFGISEIGFGSTFIKGGYPIGNSRIENERVAGAVA